MQLTHLSQIAASVLEPFANIRLQPDVFGLSESATAALHETVVNVLRTGLDCTILAKFEHAEGLLNISFNPAEFAEIEADHFDTIASLGFGTDADVQCSEGANEITRKLIDWLYLAAAHQAEVDLYLHPAN